MSQTSHDHNEVPSLPTSTGPGSRVTVAEDVSELPYELQRRYPAGWRRFVCRSVVQILLYAPLIYAFTSHDFDSERWIFSLPERSTLNNMLFFGVLGFLTLYGAILAWRRRTRPGAHFPWPLLLEHPERQEFWSTVRHPRVGSTAVIRDIQKRWVNSLALRGRGSTIFLTFWTGLVVLFIVTGQSYMLFAWVPMLAQQLYLVWARPKAEKLANALGVEFSEG